MHKLITLTIIILSFFSLQAQQLNFSFEVIYQFIFQTDSLKPQSFIKEKTILLSGFKESIFFSEQHYLSTNLLKETNLSNIHQITEKIKNSGSGVLLNIEILKDFDKNNITQKEKFWGNYSITEPINMLQWNITGDTLKILNFNCQKAITYFKGRTYTAWFTTEIPSKDGPWKLCGLPGLILKAEDATGQVKFNALEIKEEISVNFYSTINNTQNITSYQLKKLKDVFYENPKEFIENNWSPSASNHQGMKINFPEGYKVKIPANAIEIKY